MMDKKAFEKYVRNELVQPALLLFEKAGIVKIIEDKVVLTEKGNSMYERLRRGHKDVEQED